MLTSSFSQVDGIGLARERALWRAGIHEWDDLLEQVNASTKSLAGIRSGHLHRLVEEIQQDKTALLNQDFEFLCKRLKRRDHWKLYRHFPEKFAFLDIETTGLDRHLNRITSIALHGPGDRGASLFVEGFNIEDFPGVFSSVDMVVTFAGSGFDLPFLAARFPGLKIPEGCCDLLWLGKQLGLRGGLKRIEVALGLCRPEEAEGLTGLDAVALWHRWEKTGDAASLERLLIYNLVDTVNLKPLLVKFINLMVEKHGELDFEKLQEPQGWTGEMSSITKILKLT